MKIRLLDVDGLWVSHYYKNGDTIEVEQYYACDGDDGWYSDYGITCILVEDEYECKEGVYWERIKEGVS